LDIVSISGTHILTIEKFEQRVPARKFASYKCVGSAALEARHKSSASTTEDANKARDSGDSEKATVETVEDNS
jgi:hypothetical protein